MKLTAIQASPPRRAGTTLALICLLGLAAGGSAARADVKVVTEVDVRRGDQPSGTRTVTTYVKERRARVESGDGQSVVLFDYAAKKVYRLNPAQKTYVERPLSGPGGLSGLPERAAQFVRVDVSGGVMPADGAGQTVAGFATTPFDVLADVKIEPKKGAAGALARRRGGRSGGGGAAGQFQGMSIHVRGSFQGAAVASLFPGGGAPASEEALRALAQPLLEGLNAVPGAESLAADMARLKVVPLKGSVTVNRSGGGAASVPAGPMTLAMEVRSLDQKVRLEDALFRVPTGYTKAAAPAANPGADGRRGRGRASLR